jgi:hypothetical protein
MLRNLRYIKGRVVLILLCDFFYSFCKELTVKWCRDLSQAGMKDVSIVYYVFKN